MPELNHPTTGLMLSGGVDSAVLLDWLLARGWRVVPFYVQTGCVWEQCERNAVRRFLAAVAHPRLLELVSLEMPLEDVYGDHWSITGDEVPNESSSDEAVFLFGRNPLLLVKPALWCGQHGVEQLALATLAGNPFEDATPAFFAQFESMLQEATGQRLHIVRPFDRLPKHNVMELGRHLPLELTFSCLAPVDGLHCGHCNKCAERRKAFRQLRFVDRTAYADAATKPTATGIVAK